MAGSGVDIMIALLSIFTAAANTPSLDDPAVVTHTTSEIRIDGLLTEPIWDSAIPVTTFKRYMPTDGDGHLASLKYASFKMKQHCILAFA